MKEFVTFTTDRDCAAAVMTRAEYETAGGLPADYTDYVWHAEANGAAAIENHESALAPFID
jgi:hypothetical protein|tara:strand:- start:1794 stop:1976 length:183 start_codon:yes stop_codon:yes gene_type:complete